MKWKKCCEKSQIEMSSGKCDNCGTVQKGDPEQDRRIKRLLGEIVRGE